MAAHTPGPWHWDQGDIGHETSHRYCDVYTDSEMIIAQVNDLPDRIAGAANARLIAAAPDLLTDIEWTISRLDVDGGMTAKEQKTTARRLRQTLAKAANHD